MLQSRDSKDMNCNSDSFRTKFDAKNSHTIKKVNVVSHEIGMPLVCLAEHQNAQNIQFDEVNYE